MCTAQGFCWCLCAAIKQRIQLFHSPYRSCADCLQRVWKTEGVRALYRSFGTQLLMSLPFQSTHFVVYEASQNALNPTRRYNPFTHLVSGSLAGGFAAFLTTPLDVCKTFLNTQSMSTMSASERCLLATGERCVYGKNPAFMGTQTETAQTTTSSSTASSPRNEGCAHSSTTSSSAQRVAAPCHNPCHPSQISLQQQPLPASHVHQNMSSSTQVSHAHHLPSRVSPLGSATGSLAATPTTISPGLRPLFTGAPALPSVATDVSMAHGRAGVVVRGLVGAVREVYRAAGVRGFFLGVSARCLHQMPATAISWSVYEAFKFSLTRRERRLEHQQQLLRHANSE